MPTRRYHCRLPSLTGFYINLDRSPERAAFMQAQLMRLGMPWVQRLAATDAQHVALPPDCPLLPGEYACFLSHLRAVEQADDDGFTLVLEDDTELSEQLPGILGRALDAPLPAFDVAMLECQPQFSLAHISQLWDAASRHLIGASRRIAGIDLMDARLFYKWGTPGYVIPPGARTRLLARMRAWLAEGPMLPIDRRFERAFAQGELQGVVTVPFLVTTGLQWHGRSTIGTGARLPSGQLMVLRRLLYAGEFAAAEALLPRDGRAAEPRVELLALVLRELAARQRAEAAPRPRKAASP